MINKVFLGGGGDIDVSYKFDEIFFDSLPQSSNLLYIPVALATTTTKKEMCLDWFSKLISTHSTDNRFIDFSVWNDGDKMPDLDKFDAIYVGGGNTYLLLKILEKTNMLEKIKQYIIDGGIYYGGSAGAIIVGKDLLPVEEENLIKYTNHIGMNLINEMSIYPHFSGYEDQDVIIHKICFKHGLKIAAIPEDSGLILDHQELKGFNNVYLYEREKETVFYTSGQIIK